MFCKPKYRAKFFQYILVFYFYPLCLFLTALAVRISLPSIFSVLNRVGKSEVRVLNRVRVWEAGPHHPTRDYVESSPGTLYVYQLSWFGSPCEAPVKNKHQKRFYLFRNHFLFKYERYDIKIGYNNSVAA